MCIKQFVHGSSSNLTWNDYIPRHSLSTCTYCEQNLYLLAIIGYPLCNQKYSTQIESLVYTYGDSHGLKVSVTRQKPLLDLKKRLCFKSQPLLRYCTLSPCKGIARLLQKYCSLLLESFILKNNIKQLAEGNKRRSIVFIRLQAVTCTEILTQYPIIDDSISGT